MPDLLVRGLSLRTHVELKRRAEAEGLSLQAYVARLLEHHVERPALATWLQRLEQVRPIEAVSGAEVIEAVRAELP